MHLRPCRHCVQLCYSWQQHDGDHLLGLPSCCTSCPQSTNDIVPLHGLHLFTSLLSRAGKHPFLAQPADRAAFLDFALKMLLHQPPSLLVTESSANERTGITPFSRQFEEFVSPMLSNSTHKLL